MNNKKYNPFKMWGAWLGVIIVLLFQFKFIGTIIGFILPSEAPFIGMATVMNAIGTLLLFMLGGFLVGWAIHSLLRKFVGW